MSISVTSLARTSKSPNLKRALISGPLKFLELLALDRKFIVAKKVTLQ